MSKRQKVGPNDPCPCWSGKKFKKCCKGIVDWTKALTSGDSYLHLLSARGRNFLFLEAISDALQLDLDQITDVREYKRAFTPRAVEKIHEAIVEIWPVDTDWRSVLKRSNTGLTGIYIGDYSDEYLLQAIKRHCLYADKIILMDPFTYPPIMRPR